MMILLSQFNRQNPNFIYETGISEEGMVLIKRGRETLILAHPLVIGSVKKHSGIRVEMFSKTRLLKEIKGEEVKTDYENASAHFLGLLKKNARKVMDISREYHLRRAKKKSREVQLIKKAAKIAEDSLLEVSGESEEEIKWSIIRKFAERQAYEAFPTIVANKENSRFPHHIPTSEAAREHILIDRGAKYKNYCSDLTDVLYVKGRASKIYEELQDIFYTMVDELPRMEFAKEVHTLYVKLYEKKKMRLPPHLIGHGVGIEVHEHPRLYKDEDFPLEGTVLAIEPSYYGRSFGLRFERLVHVKARKATVL